MDVEDPPAERRQHPRPDDAHVARQDDDLGPDRGQRLLERGVVATRHQGGLEAALGRPVERRTWPVGEDEFDLAAEATAFGGRRQRPQVRARPRHADRDPTRLTHVAASGSSRQRW